MNEPRKMTPEEMRLVFGNLWQPLGASVDRIQGHLAALEKERDAALADNAAKAATIQRMRNLLLYPTMDAEATRLEVLRLGLDAVAHPGPGAALLKEHHKARAERDEARAALAVACESTDAGIRIIKETSAALGLPDIRHSLPEEARKALVCARNEGLEKAAQASDDAADEAEARAEAASASPNLDAANWDNGAANEARNIATRIRAMKEPE